MLALGDAKPHGAADPEFVRTKASEAYNLFATSARAVLQHGTNEEAWIVHIHIDIDSDIILFFAAVTVTLKGCCVSRCNGHHPPAQALYTPVG